MQAKWHCMWIMKQFSCNAALHCQCMQQGRASRLHAKTSPDRLHAGHVRAAHDTTAQHADAIIDFFEAAASKSQVPAREDHPVFSERYSTDSASAAHAKQLSELPSEPKRHHRHHLQVR